MRTKNIPAVMAIMIIGWFITCFLYGYLLFKENYNKKRNAKTDFKKQNEFLKFVLKKKMRRKKNGKEISAVNIGFGKALRPRL